MGDRYRHLGFVFGVTWLVFMVLPVVDVVQSGRPIWVKVAELAGFAVFVAVYAGFFLRIRFERSRLTVAMLVALTGIATALAAADGSLWVYLFIYVSIVTGTAFRPRWSVVAVLLVTGLAVATTYLTGQGLYTLFFILMETLLPGLGSVGIAATIRTNIELRQAREEIARLAVAEERLRFARDLHDLLGHSLSVIVLKAELAGRLATERPDRTAGEVRDIERVAREALREVRDAVVGYRQPALAQELESARTTLEAAGVAVHVEAVAGALPTPVDSTLAWAVREGVTNVVRHSQARHVEVHISRRDDCVGLELLDDGVGCETCDGGSGLRGLGERVAARDGSLDYGRRVEGGFRLAVSLPMKEVPRPAPALK
jgi:two-component system sensor histidine kinase DesK